MTDFPAAHSMDTTWFAIDRDGHVAVFASGEAGCVPTDAYLGEDYGPLEDALRALPATGAVYDLSGQRAAAGADHVALSPNVEGWRLLVFARDAEVARTVLGVTVIAEVATTSGTGFVVRASFKDLTALHDRGACDGCFLGGGEDESELASHGAFSYAHECENWISGPYARTAAPATPLTEAAIPAEVVEHAVRFDGRFAETPELQPAELWPCESWEPAWLASDRKTVRPFAGREDEYAEQVAGLRDVEPELVFVDVPAAPDRAAAEASAPPTARARRTPWWKFW